IRDRNVTGVQTCALPILSKMVSGRLLFQVRSASRCRQKSLVWTGSSRMPDSNGGNPDAACVLRWMMISSLQAGAVHPLQTVILKADRDREHVRILSVLKWLLWLPSKELSRM